MYRFRRNEPDYLKYGQLDPEDDEVFFGPVTLRELKKSVEVEEKIVQRRLLEKKAHSQRDKKIEQNQTEDKENQDEDLDRTFDIEDDESKEQIRNTSSSLGPLTDITQSHQNLEETKLIEMSVQFSNTSIKLSKPARIVKGSGCLLDDTLNVNESIKERLQTPLIDKFFKSGTTVSMKEPQTPSKNNDETTFVHTPCSVKLSGTFVADVTPNVLNTTIPDEINTKLETVKRINTPDIFEQKQNEIWKDLPDLRKSAFKSKLPKKKTPVKDRTYLFPKSPVADYIHRGIKVQSMSKQRHSHCILETLEARSKSDHKSIQHCKIPVPVSDNVKRKLNLTASTSKSSFFRHLKD